MIPAEQFRAMLFFLASWDSVVGVRNALRARTYVKRCVLSMLALGGEARQQVIRSSHTRSKTARELCYVSRRVTILS